MTRSRFELKSGPDSGSITKPFARAVVLGRAAYDLYSEDIGAELDRVRHFRVGLGGSSANIAVGLARLGWQVTMFSAVSDDAVGRFVCSELAAEGVDASAIQVVRRSNTQLVLTQVAPPLGAEQVFYRSRPADSALVWNARMGKILADHNTIPGIATIFLTNGTSLSSASSRAATERALQGARAAGMTTVLDVDYRASSWRSPASAGAAVRAVWHWVDILFSNAEEMRLLSTQRTREAPLEEVVAKAALRAGVKIVIWKRGAVGSAAFTADSYYAVPAASVDVVSTNGAGDALAAGFLTAYARGLVVSECLRYGSAAAGWVVGQISCADAMPRMVELEQSLTTVHHNPLASL